MIDFDKFGKVHGAIRVREHCWRFAVAVGALFVGRAKFSMALRLSSGMMNWRPVSLTYAYANFNRELI